MDREVTSWESRATGLRFIKQEGCDPRNNEVTARNPKNEDGLIEHFREQVNKKITMGDLSRLF